MRNKKNVFPIVKSAKTFSHRKRSFRTLSCPHKGTVRLRCIMKKGWFLPSAMSLLITYFIDLNLEKEIIVLEKSLEKSVPALHTSVVGSKQFFPEAFSSQKKR